MKKLYKLTQEGMDELAIEKDKLILERPNITERIKTAREMGDLSENAEYAAARSEQDRDEARIAEIDAILKNSEVIQAPKGDKNKVNLGNSVKLISANGQAKQFQVVGTVEADPLNGKISDESPIGQALIGKKLGDSVEIVTPAETVTYEIKEIS